MTLILPEPYNLTVDVDRIPQARPGAGLLNNQPEETPTPRLSIVVPAYNEEQRLQGSLLQIAEYVGRQSYTSEVIVSDDGSTDATSQLAEALAAQHPWLRIIREPSNRGKGAAVRNGVLQARGEFVLMCDADLATPIEELDNFWACIELGADVVIASRPLKASHLVRRQPLYREMAGRMFNLAVQLFAVWGIRDTQCGFKLFRGETARRLFSMSVRDGWDFDIEILYLARRLGYRIVEVPVHWYHRDGSKVRMLRDGMCMLAGIAAIRWHHLRIKGTARDADR